MESDVIYTQDQYPQDYPPIENRQQVPGSILFMLPFILGAISVTFVPGLNLLVVGLGFLAFAAFLFYALKAGFLFAPELKCLMVYFVIATLGVFVTEYPIIFFTAYRTAFLILLMTVMVMNYARSMRVVKLILFTIFLGSIIVGSSAVWTGEFTRAEAEGERAAGFAMNSNAFGINLIFATIVSLYFFKTFKSWILKTGFIGFILVFGRLILASGSRTGFLGFLTALFLWFVFSYAAQIKKRPISFVLGLMVIIAVVGVFYIWSEGTLIEKRLTESSQEDSRVSLYVEGIKVVFNHLLLGVSLNHYQVYSRFELYSHSNYIEVFSCTGVFGGIAYFLIYIILWVRLWKLGKYPMEPDEREWVAFGKMYILLRCAIDLVSVSYYDKANWIFFSILIGWTYYKQQQIQRQQSDLSAEPQSYDQVEYQYQSTPSG